MEPYWTLWACEECLLYVFWGGHKIWGEQHLLDIVLVFEVPESSCLLDVLEGLYKFVFESTCRVLTENFISVGVL